MRPTVGEKGRKQKDGGELNRFIIPELSNKPVAVADTAVVAVGAGGGEVS